MKQFALALLLLLTLQACSDLDELFESSRMQPINEVEKAKYESFPFENMAPNAPPPARSEFKGNPPGNIPDEYTWRNGHWSYVDGQGFNWKNGYWLRKPAFSASWKQDMWLQRTYGWTLVPGYWE
ncbi:MAG: hypothetical protein EB059_02550 [Alphaproteobacteria bacterium]|nr:hypothetical protein [Alphaproteobacteria bacterium]